MSQSQEIAVDVDQWTTVKGKHKVLPVVQQKETAAAKEAPKNRALPQSSSKSKAFTAFDKKFMEQAKRAQIARDVLEDKENFLTEEINTPETPPQKESEAAAVKTKQAKVKKTKKAKNTPASSSAAPVNSKLTYTGISRTELKLILDDVEARYPQNENARLEMIADRLLVAYKESDSKFLTRITQDKVENTVDILEGTLLPESYTELSAYMPILTTQGISTSLLLFVKVILNSIASSNGQLIETQTGLLCLISVICRMCPPALILCLRKLVKEGGQKLDTAKLSFLIWLFAQAEKAAYGSALCCWLEVILPHLVSEQGVTNEKKEAGKNVKPKFIIPDNPENLFICFSALKYAMHSTKKDESEYTFSQEFLKALKSTGYNINRVNCLREDVDGIPVISGDSFNLIIMNALKEDSDMPSPVSKTLRKNLKVIRQIVFSNKSKGYMQSLTVSSLLLAGMTEANNIYATKDPVLKMAAENLCECLYRDLECFNKWIVCHKDHIKGSAKIINLMQEDLAGNTKIALFQDLLKDTETRKSFYETCKSLQDRHRVLLAQGKGKNAYFVQTAHSALKTILKLKDTTKPVPKAKKSKKAASNSSSSSIASHALLALVLCAALAASCYFFQRDIEALVQQYLATEGGQKLSIKITQILESSGLDNAIAVIREQMTIVKSAIEGFIFKQGY